MNYFIWIGPLLISIVSAIYFNKKTANMVAQNNIRVTALDIVSSYSISMMFYNLLATQGYFYSFIFFLTGIIALLFHLNITNKNISDIDTALETIKNTLIVQMTTFLPFILFSYVLKTIDNTFLVLTIALISSLFIFIVSIYVKKVINTLLEKVSLSAQLATSKGTILLYSVIAFIITGLFIFAFSTSKEYVSYDLLESNSYLIASYDTSDQFDWETTTIIDYIYTFTPKDELSDAYLLVLDSDNVEHFVVIKNMHNGYDEATFETYIIGEHSDEVLLSGTRLQQQFLDVLITSPRGLLRYGLHEDPIMPEKDSLGVRPVFNTEDKFVAFFELDSITHVLVKDSPNNYTIINTIGDTLASISNENLTIISNTLFIRDFNEYILYEQPSISFPIIDNTEPTYNKERETLYQLEYNETNVIIHTSTITQQSLFSLSINNSDMLFLIPNDTLYNARNLLTINHETTINQDLVIHANQHSDNSFNTFVSYNPNKYTLKIDSSGNLKVHEKAVSQYVSYTLSTLEFDNNKEKLATNSLHTALRYSLLAVIFFFIPITNYESHTVISSFKEQTYSESSKKS